MTALAPDTLIQVLDQDGRWHAAAVGPGVLCQRAKFDQAAPVIQTVQWAPGTDLVDCSDCRGPWVSGRWA